MSKYVVFHGDFESAGPMVMIPRAHARYEPGHLRRPIRRPIRRPMRAALFKKYANYPYEEPTTAKGLYFIRLIFRWMEMVQGLQ